MLLPIEELPLETFALLTDSSVVMQMQYVVVSSVQVIFTQNAYAGMIGGREVALTRLSDQELLFSVPDSIEGESTLELLIGNQVGRIVFTIQTNEIRDIEATVKTELTDPLTDFSMSIEDLLKDNTLPDAVTNDLNSSNQLLKDYLAQFAILSSDEKLEVARFYHANPLFTTDHFKVLKKANPNSNPNYDCFAVNSNRVIMTTLAILTFVNGLAYLGASSPMGSVAAMAGFVAGVYAAVSIISAAQEHLLHECFLPFKHALVDATGSGRDLKVYNNRFEEFRLMVSERHLITSDANGKNTLLSNTANKLSLAHARWKELKRGLNRVLSTSGNWFISWFKSAPLPYEPITYDLEALPSESEERENEGDVDFISITGFPPDVTVSVDARAGDPLKLRLVTSSGALPRKVSGKIKYSDGDFTTEDSLSVTIFPDDPCLDIFAPEIVSYTLVCENGDLVILVDFTAEGRGYYPSGGSLWCDPANTCYPSRLYFRSPGAEEFSIAYNGYDVKLNSGNYNEGTIAFRLRSGHCAILPGLTPVEVLANRYPGYEWKIELIQACDLRSNTISF